MKNRLSIFRTITLLLLGGGVFGVECCSLIHDDQVVASVGNVKLFRSQLDLVIPESVTGEDSIRMATNYINAWASDLLYLQVAEEQLSKDDLDVSQELADYRRSILKYRYEQRYVDDRLDTTVRESQIEEYYKEHKEKFVLERPVLKARFVSLMNDAPHKAEILRLLSSDRNEDLDLLDTLAFHSALKYFDWTDRWVDAGVLASEFGVDSAEMLSHLKGNRIAFSGDGHGPVREAYVAEIVKSGIAPVEFCESRIKDILINSRKHSLLSSLEQDLLENARESKKFVIY